jgi:hypothetical protein
MLYKCILMLIFTLFNLCIFMIMKGTSWIYNYLCNIRAYHHYSCKFESRPWQGVLDTILCDKVSQYSLEYHDNRLKWMDKSVIVIFQI